MKSTVTRGMLALVATGLAVWLGSGLILAGKHQKEPPKVVNLTESFQVVSIERRGSDVVLQVKNSSSKLITAYSLSMGVSGNSIMQTDFAPNLTKQGLAPGEIESITIPLAQNPLTIEAIVFEDGSSEGNFLHADRIRAYRTGDRIQSERIRALITKATASTDLDIKALRGEIASLQSEAQSGPLGGFRAGMNFAKQWALSQLDHLEAGELDDQIRLAPNYDARRAVLPGGKLRLGLELINAQVTKKLARY